LADDEQTRMLAQVNLWLAKSGRLGLDSIRAEVEAWNTDSLGPSMNLAKLVILEHDEEAVDLIAHLVDKGSLPVLAIREWPLFHRMRRLGLLTDLLAF
jgi:hypothetical protein